MSEPDKLRVFHVASGDLWGGAEAQLLTLAKQLHTHSGIDVTVVLLNHGQLEARLVEHNIPTIVFDEQKMGFLSILIGLTKLFNDKRPQVIHSHRQKENILASLANVLSVRAKCLRTQHGAPEFQYSWMQLHKKIQYWLDCFCGRYLQSKIVAVSSELATNLERSFPSSHIEVIENGVDVENVCLVASSSDLLVFSPTNFHVGIVGRLVPVKRVDIFIETAKKLHVAADLSKPILFHVFGDGGLRGVLEAQVVSLAMQDVIHFHGHRDDILSCIQHLDILLMCSDHEGLPMTAIEAMALETPVVTHNVGGLKPFYQERKGGVLSQQHSVESYFNEIHKLLDDPKAYEDVCKSGREVVNTVLSAERNAVKIIQLYKCLTQKNRRRLLL